MKGSQLAVLLDFFQMLTNTTRFFLAKDFAYNCKLLIIFCLDTSACASFLAGVMRSLVSLKSASSTFTRKAQVRFLPVHVQLVQEASQQILTSAVTVCHNDLVVGKLSSSGEGSRAVKREAGSFTLSMKNITIFVSWNSPANCPWTDF